MNNLWMDFLINDKDKYWFVSGTDNNLFYINKSDYMLHLFKSIPCKAGVRMFNSGLIFENQIWLFPYNAGEIIVFDKTTNEFESIEIDKKYSRKAQFSMYIKNNDFAYVFDSNNQHICMEVNLKTRNIKYYSFDEFVEPTQTLSRDIVLYNNKIVICVKESPAIIFFDVNTKEFRAYNIKGIMGGFDTIAAYKDRFYLSGKQGIYIWDGHKENVEIMKDFPESFRVQSIKYNIINLYKLNDVFTQNLNTIFWKSFVYGKKLILISAYANMSLILDCETKKISAFDLEEKETLETLKEYPINLRATSIEHLFAQIIDNKLFCFLSRDNSILEIRLDEDLNTIYKIKCNICDEDLLCMISKNKNYVYENSQIDLVKWIEIINC